MPPKNTRNPTDSLYDMGAVCQLTGLSPHVLRSWESRYAVVAPRRLKNGRRAYSAEDLRKLRTLKALVDHGHRIGTLSTLSDPELAARLEDVGAEDGPRESWESILGITVIGEMLRDGSRSWVLTPPSYIDARYGTIEEARADPGRPRNDVVAVELSILHENTLRSLDALADDLSAQHVLVAYAFGPHHRLRRSAGPRTTLLNGRLTESRLDAELARLNRELAVTASKTPPVMHRRYSPDQLEKIAAIAAAVECECPRHVSALLSELLQFEDYSAECENLKPGDAEMHRYLLQMTARARNIMEQAMARLITQEQIRI